MSRSTNFRRRAFRAYWTTFAVLSSYSYARFLRLFQSEERSQRLRMALHVRNARRLERAISELGGLFVKVGQLFSILTNFLPTEFRRELEGLQDAMPPRPFEDVRRRIVEELGREPHELFAEFETRPLASASLGQVHAAVLPTGERVAVKVQYPDVEERVQDDLRMLRIIVRIVGRYFRTVKLGAIYREIEKMALEELDFSQEASHLETIRKNLEGCEFVALPKVYREMSTQRVLTTQLMNGVKVTALLEGRIADGGPGARTEVARRIVDAYCRQIFDHGVYHADPHPGNILVTSDLQVVLLDFGAVGTLDLRMRQGIVRFLQGVLTGDTDRILGALRDMGFVQQNSASDKLERVLAAIHERLRSAIRLETMALSDIKLDSRLVLDALLDLRALDVGLRELSEAFHVPSEWILLERTILMLTGICTTLDHELQPMEIIRPYVERLVLSEGEDWTSFGVETAKQVGAQLVVLPAEVRKALGILNRGRLEIRAPHLEDSLRRVYALGQQLMWTAFTISAGALSTVCELLGRSELATRFEWATAVFALLLMRSIFRARLRA